MRRQMLEEKKKKIDDKEDEEEKFFKKQKKKEKKKMRKRKGEENCVWGMFYFSIDNKEEMFIRSASVQAAHNSLLNIQYIFHTHTIQHSTSGKKCVPNHPTSHKKKKISPI